MRKSLSDEDLVQKGCNIVSEHAQLRGMDVEGETVAEPDDLHPKYLPRWEESLYVDYTYSL